MADLILQACAEASTIKPFQSAQNADLKGVKRVFPFVAKMVTLVALSVLFGCVAGAIGFSLLPETLFILPVVIGVVAAAFTAVSLLVAFKMMSSVIKHKELATSSSSTDSGNGVTQLILAANQGDPESQYNLAVLYQDGKGMDKDLKQALYYYTLAADKGNVKAQFTLGLLYGNGHVQDENFSKTFYYFSLAAKQGDAGAQANLGIHYEFGKGVNQDFQQAVEYYTLAANQRHPGAQFRLGFLYECGKGVEQNFVKAFEYYTAAQDKWFPEQNFTWYPEATNNLGSLYYRGEGVEKSLEKAAIYYTLAANQGHEKAKEGLDTLKKASSEK